MIFILFWFIWHACAPDSGRCAISQNVKYEISENCEIESNEKKKAAAEMLYEKRICRALCVPHTFCIFENVVGKKIKSKTNRNTRKTSWERNYVDHTARHNP